MKLSDCTVLEIGEYVSAPYAGKILSDLGATVVKVEPPRGDVARQVGPFVDDEPGLERSGFFGYLNTGKRSVTLPRNAVAPRVVRDLVDAHAVDLVIGDIQAFDAYKIDPKALSNGSDQLSVVSISGFGATGPFSQEDAPDLIAWAESGQMNKTGYPDDPPTRPRIKSTDYWAGQTACLSGLNALLGRDLQGTDGQFVDVSKREAAISSMEHYISGYSWSGESSERTGSGYGDQGEEFGFPTIFEAADGYFSAAVTTPGVWEAFCQHILERPELIEDERFATQDARQQHLPEVQELVAGYTKNHNKWELFEEFQELGAPSAVTTMPEEVLDFDHLQERNFWQDVPLSNGDTVTMPGFPFRPGGPDHPVEMDRAPQLGEHADEIFAPLEYDPTTLASTSFSGEQTEEDTGRSSVAETDLGGNGTLPLEGIKVLDFTWVFAGPTAGKYLAALGADVVKIESENKPDLVRNGWGYADFDPTENQNVSAYFNEHNQGKREINLNLNSERGQELARELASEADVWMESYAPGFLDSVGLTYEDIQEVNPEIVYLSMPGWATTGPAKNHRSFGLNLQSMAGMDAISGHPDAQPTTAGFSWPDPTAGYMGAIAVTAGLYHQHHAGESTYIELPQFEMTVSFLHKPMMEQAMNDHAPERVGNRDEDNRYIQGAYECTGEDNWAVIAVKTDAQWKRLCEAIGRPELVDDERFESQYDRLRNHDAVDEVIEAWTRERSREEVRQRLQNRDVPAGIVANEQDLMDYDPQLRVRSYFSEHDHPDVGTQRYQGVPFKMEGCDVRFRSAAPQFGEHTEEVLSEWLDMPVEEVKEKREAGVLA